MCAKQSSKQDNLDISSTCKHADDYFAAKTNTQAYGNILSALCYPISLKSVDIKSKTQCSRCSSRSHSHKKLSLVMICAHCKFFGCWQNNHLRDHQRGQSNHCISVALDNGELFCSICNDFVYHHVAEKILKKSLEMYAKYHGIPPPNDWRPSFDELQNVPHIAGVIQMPLDYHPMYNNRNSTRGLLNMGNTCFLNVVVQALTHTPVLRDYLLADVHRCETAAQSRNCLACEMIRITQEIYRPISTPYVPCNLLHSIWLHASHLAGYEQRDAHEFLITLLTLIHSHLTASTSPSPVSSSSSESTGQTHNASLAVTSDSGISSSNSSASSAGSTLINNYSTSALTRDNCCDCVIHQVFYGNLKSVITYEGCEHQSTIVDPFLDLSLDVVQRGSTSLNACLQSYFRPEQIEGSLLCAQCNVKRPAVKQFSLLQLPNVLCFYLKRCHHDTKLPTSISFPMDLDLAPFVPHFKTDRSAWHDRYSLYAVLNHSGQTNSGHYVAYIRADANSWCLCDDHKIFPVTQEHVLKTDAYVLLYHKNLLAINSTVA